jgi:DNA-binding YbaB/EbfC family protein
MKGGLGNLMKQAQAMQDNLRKAQEELATIEVEGKSGGGMVKVTMTCRHDIRKVDIDDSMMNSEDKEVLEDLIAAAVNDAVRKVEQTTQEKMAGLTGGLNIPGLNLQM